jgi:hypothetical protein
MSYPDIRCRILTYDVECSILAYDIEYDIAYDIAYDVQHMDALSGGIFHYKKDLAYNTSMDCCGFYHDVPENTLFNDVFCYFVHNLPKLQNMHLYKITSDTNVKTLVTTSYRALAGPPSVPETYPLSKELVAYLETLIAFSVYYRADDPRMSGKTDQFYTKALAGYKDTPYAGFHKYIIRKLDNWYRLFPFKKNYGAAEYDSFSGEEGNVVAVPAVDASQVGRSFNMSDGEENDGDKEADNIAAVEVAEARLADGAAEGRAAVAAAGAGEVASAAATVSNA